MSVEDKKDLRILRKEALKTGRAWPIKEMFSDFWSYKYQASAKKFFDQWFWWATHSRLKLMSDVAKMLKRHFKNIVTYLKHGITNALIEGFNSKTQSIKANARGYRNFEDYRVAILFFCGKVGLYP